MVSRILGNADYKTNTDYEDSIFIVGMKSVQLDVHVSVTLKNIG